MLHISFCSSYTDTVNFTLTSSEMYACLGETYKMNCTSTESFSRCNVSFPCWFKDDKPFRCLHNNCKSYGSQTEELSVHLPYEATAHHVYYCGAGQVPKYPCQHRSNSLTVKPLSKPDYTMLHIMNVHACNTLAYYRLIEYVAVYDCDHRESE